MSPQHVCADCSKTIEAPTGSLGQFLNGRAETTAGESLCYPCADKRQIEQLKERAPMFVYMSSDEKALTTWTGGKLASITSVRKARNNFGGTTRYYFRATDIHGRAWYGTSPGPNMFARMRPAKESAS